MFQASKLQKRWSKSVISSAKPSQRQVSNVACSNRGHPLPLGSSDIFNSYCLRVVTIFACDWLLQVINTRHNPNIPKRRSFAKQDNQSREKQNQPRHPAAISFPCLKQTLTNWGLLRASLHLCTSCSGFASAHRVTMSPRTVLLLHVVILDLNGINRQPPARPRTVIMQSYNYCGQWSGIWAWYVSSFAKSTFSTTLVWAVISTSGKGSDNESVQVLEAWRQQSRWAPVVAKFLGCFFHFFSWHFLPLGAHMP